MPAKPKIVFVIAKAEIGGAEIHTMGLAEGLRARGFDAAVFAIRHGPATAEWAVLNPKQSGSLPRRVRDLRRLFVQGRFDIAVGVNLRAMAVVAWRSWVSSRRPRRRTLSLHDAAQLQGRYRPAQPSPDLPCARSLHFHLRKPAALLAWAGPRPRAGADHPQRDRCGPFHPVFSRTKSSCGARAALFFAGRFCRRHERGVPAGRTIVRRSKRSPGFAPRAARSRGCSSATAPAGPLLKRRRGRWTLPVTSPSPACRST